MISEWFWKKLNQISTYTSIALLFALAFFEANIEVKDLDLWLHIGTGRYILENFTIPSVDVLSFTINGSPWINHEWLFQVIVALIYDNFGINGIISLQVAVVSLTVFILFLWGYKTDKKTGTIVFLLLALLNYQMRFTHRPDLFSLLFLVLYIQILSIGLRNKTSLAIIFFIQVLWTNMHGFFILGPLLIAIAVGSEWIKQRVRLPFQWNSIGKISQQEFNLLIWMLVVSIGACFINPCFAKGVWYPLKVLFSLNADSKIFFENIGELARPIDWNNILNFGRYPYYKVLMIISFFSFVFNFKKIDIGAVFLWVIFLFISLKATRNIAYFAFISFFCILSNYQYFYPKYVLNERLIKLNVHRILSIGLKIILCFWMLGFFQKASLAGYFSFDTYERKSEYGGVSLRNYPQRAVDFLDRAKIEGNFYNDFNSGAYLIGRVFPRVKVFMDGRTEVYGAEYFKKYKDIWYGNYEQFKKAADQYNITGVFLNSIMVPAPHIMLNRLYFDTEWRLVYFDYDAVIFLRDIEQNRKWINQYEVDLDKYKVPPIDLMRLGVRPATPYEHIRRAYALFNLGYIDLAKSEAREILRVEPSYSKAYNLLGKIDLENKDYMAAFENFRKAKVCSVNDMEARYYLGKSLAYLNNLDEAQKQCNKALTLNPEYGDALYLLSFIYVKQRRYDQAVDAAKTAYHNSPHEIELLNEIVKEFQDQGMNDYAAQVAELPKGHPVQN